MFRQICHTLLFRWGGWKEEVDQPRPKKCIICIAPHTSNWDFLIGKSYYTALGLTSNFLMKKEWFFWPLGPIFRKMGGIPVERSKKTSLTDQLAELALKSPTFSLAVTPEGTRSANPDWKLGFYFIAMKAQLPILLYGIDYEKRLIACRKTIVPNGDVEKQLKEVKDYFRDFKGKIPDNFAL